MDLMDIFDDVAAKKPEAEKVEPKAEDANLETSVADRAAVAAEAHDSYIAAKAAYDDKSDELRATAEGSLATLYKALRLAGEAEKEAVTALDRAMEKAGITNIPMTDRPDVKVKITKGGKSGITRKWLMDPEGVAIKTLDTAMKGEEPKTTATEVAKKIWDSQPKSADKKKVIIPDRYEDEPDH